MENDLEKERYDVGRKYIPQEMIKTSLLALGTVMCAIAWLWIGCFGQTLSSPFLISMLGFITITLVVIFWGYLSPFEMAKRLLTLLVFAVFLIGAPASLTITNEWCHLVKSAVVVLLSVATTMIILFSGYNRKENNFSFLPIINICLTFGAITLLGVKPLSKYNNINQLARDKHLAEILQVTPDKEGTEIVLPSEHVSNHKYLENVFLVKTDSDPNGISWSGGAIFCKEGVKEWYKMPITTNPAEREIIFLFRHTYQNYEELKKIPSGTD